MTTPERAPTRARPVARFVLAGVLLVVAAIVVAATTNGAVLRLIGGVAVVLVPGACLVAILRLRPRDRAEAVLLALGLGLAGLIVGGLLVDLVTNLSPAGWAGFLAVLVGVALLTMRPRSAVDETTSVDAARSPGAAVAANDPTGDASADSSGSTAPSPRRQWPIIAITGILCAVAIGVAVSISVDSAQQQSGVGFTTLAFELDRDAPADERPASVGILVENRERVTSTYRLVVSDGDRTLLDVADIQLDADEHVRHDVGTDGVASGAQLRAVLFRDGGAEPYRSVTYTLP